MTDAKRTISTAAVKAVASIAAKSDTRYAMSCVRYDGRLSATDGQMAVIVGNNNSQTERFYRVSTLAEDAKDLPKRAARMHPETKARDWDRVAFGGDNGLEIQTEKGGVHECECAEPIKPEASFPPVDPCFSDLGKPECSVCFDPALLAKALAVVNKAGDRSKDMPVTIHFYKRGNLYDALIQPVSDVAVSVLVVGCTIAEGQGLPRPIVKGS